MPFLVAIDLPALFSCEFIGITGTSEGKSVNQLTPMDRVGVRWPTTRQRCHFRLCNSKLSTMFRIFLSNSGSECRRERPISVTALVEAGYRSRPAPQERVMRDIPWRQSIQSYDSSFRHPSAHH